MSLFDEHLLSLIIFVPLIGAVIALSFPRVQHSGVRGFALAVTLVDLGLAAWAWRRFDAANPALQMRESISWVPTFGIDYAVGVDGIALLLVILTTALAPIVVLSTYSSVHGRIREFVVAMLLLQTGMLGAFLAVDLFLFYVFWELMLIPMYFLIGVWGGQGRIYAALKFFLFTMAGSLLMLVAILYTVWAVRDAGGLTFSWQVVSERLVSHDLGGAETWLFLAFAVAFAIKVPLFPFHTWLPDAHVEAPTGGSVILAGVLLKLGTFGFLRYAFWMFPEAAAEFLPALGLLAVIGILYGALVAMVQEDLKRLVAYSSVSHLGFVVLGLAAMTVTGVTGGVIQMINHGVSTAALFLLVGVLYERRHTRLISDYGGVAKVMPWYAFVWVLMVMSSIGVPGLNGFVGEFMILVGAFQSTGAGIETASGDIAWAGIFAVMAVAAGAWVMLAVSLIGSQRESVGAGTKLLGLGAAALGALAIAAPPIGDFDGGLLVRPLVGVTESTEAFGEVFATLAVFAASGVIFAAIYLLWATQRVFFGPITQGVNENLQDLTTREVAIFVPLVLAAIGLGLYPKPALDVIEPTVTATVLKIRARAGLPELAGVEAPVPPADAAGFNRRGLNAPTRKPPIAPARPGRPNFRPGLPQNRLNNRPGAPAMPRRALPEPATAVPQQRQPPVRELAPRPDVARPGLQPRVPPAGGKVLPYRQRLQQLQRLRREGK